MSINWVMLAPNSQAGYTALPNEQHLGTVGPRIGLSLSTPAHYPGKQQNQPFNLSSSSGNLHLTSRRLIFIPTKAPPVALPSSSSSSSNQPPPLESFAAPILSLHDSHVTAPWFGPNVWTALLQPTPGGGLPIPSTGVIELKLTFKDGGAYDFHAKYELLRERLQQAVEASSASLGGEGSRWRSAGMAAPAEAVHLEQLPAYAERGDGPLMPPVPVPQPMPPSHREAGGVVANGVNGGGAAPSSSMDSAVGGSSKAAEAAREQAMTPDEPPPGYEEAQLAGLNEELERRRREDGEAED